MAGNPRYFDLYSANALIAWAAVSLAVTALFACRNDFASSFRNLFLLWAASTLVSIIGAMIFYTFGPAGSALRAPLALAFLGLSVLLVLSMVMGARQAFKAAGAPRPGWRAVGFTAALSIALSALPNWPLYVGPDFKRSQANLWELAAAGPQPSDAEQKEWADTRRKAEERNAKIEAAQPARLDAELARVTPRASRKHNVFVVGVAGWSDQDVFVKETEQSLDILRKRLGAEGRTAALVNHPTSAETHPIANIQNLAHVLRGVAGKMNLEEDVLVLTMTSHGSRHGFALEYEDLVARTLSPGELKNMLDAIGFKNRVVIVSACYSGVFVPALSDPRTMVMTAASATRTSFGCSNDRAWTFFGDALFAHGLNEEPTLSQAFFKARQLVAQWEKEKKIEPSDPQIFVGEELRRRFPALIGAAEGANEPPKPIKQSRAGEP